MTYPDNIEKKLGIDEVRSLLYAQCMSTLGKSRVDEMGFINDANKINQLLGQTHELRQIIDNGDEFPLENFFDLREPLKRLRLEGTYMEEDNLFQLMRSMNTVCKLVDILTQTVHQPDDDDEREPERRYKHLSDLADGIPTFPQLVNRISQIVDKYGKIRDTASQELARIRSELKRMEGSISRTLYNIMRTAQSEGLVDKDLEPTLRDGRLVIPVAPQMKRRISGIVHDESATGRTVYIEPTEVVEANNRIRELEADERREIIRILTDFSKVLRPHIKGILLGFELLADVDFILAKARVAKEMKAIEPVVSPEPLIDWISARHPLLEKSLAKQNKPIHPLDIMLTPDKHILIISGPNAGGKSVCLKTTGLLQYMLQCGLSVPFDERSKAGVFDDIMIDIGDEQSIENDLSTYSSHLLNMKNMMKQASARTLLLIDEFGTGTEPQIGGAIAESVLGQLCQRGAYGVITTHYQNLKHFADSHEGIANGAMLYDRHEMQPLFKLAIGRPGSSFAIEIARKIGLPEQVIKEASDIVGSDYIQSDKYLQDIVRDKRYWENKRQNIHQQEKDLERTISRYEDDVNDIQAQRKAILKKAKEEANELLAEANRRIENTIKEIKEAQAEKEATHRLRKEIEEFKQEVNEIDTKANDEFIARKIEQIRQRKERHKKHIQEKAQKRVEEKQIQAEIAAKVKPKALSEGDLARIKGTKSTGRIELINGSEATIIIGEMRTRIKLSRLEAASAPQEQPKTKQEQLMAGLTTFSVSRDTRSAIDSRKKSFSPELNVMGMRGDEALNAVTHFIDDAILLGMAQVRILHGKGNGILRQLIRQYLATVPNVNSFRDENVQFGGAGITVVEL